VNCHILAIYQVLSPWQPEGDADHQLLGNQLQTLQRATRSCEDVQLLLRHTEAHREYRRTAEADLAVGSQQQQQQPVSLDSGRPASRLGHRVPSAAGSDVVVGSLAAMLRRHSSRNAGRREGPVTVRHSTEAITSGMDVSDKPEKAG
jgi:hypothetical protein